MTTKLLIDRELLEQVASEFEHDNDRYMLGRELRKVLDTPRQPEGDGLEVEGYFFQHEETGQVMCVDAQQVEWGFEKNNPRLIKGCALTDFDKAQRAIAELREEISDLHTTMMAAAVEIQDHWQAHCDEEGYGPANLIHRLERGIAAQYGYTAQTLVQIEAERDTLRQQLAELRAQLLAIASAEPRRHTIEWAKAMAATGNNEAYAKWREAFDQRDKLAGLLADVKADYTHAIHWEDMHATMKRIDAALAEVKP